MSLHRGGQLAAPVFALVAAALSFAASGDAPLLSTAPVDGGPARAGTMMDEDGRWPERGLGYPYPAPRYPGYGPPPGGGLGYGRGYAGNPPAYREYRRRGGGYRQHRQYANPLLYPLQRRPKGQLPLDPPGGTATLPGMPRTSGNIR